MSCELYVRRLPLDMDDDGVRRLFAVAGRVTHIHRVKDARSGEYRGTIFVKMASDAEAKEAIALLDGARLDNHDISVALSLPQKRAGETAPAADARASKVKPKPKPGRTGGRRR